MSSGGRRCSFCGLDVFADATRSAVRGNDATICAECVSVARMLLEPGRAHEARLSAWTVTAEEREGR